MKRDPKERFIKIHMDSIAVKRVKSRFFGIDVKNADKNLEGNQCTNVNV